MTLWFGTFSVRLVDGNTAREGRVELFRHGYGWGTICDDNWIDQNARVVCGMLGYEDGIALGSARFGEGVGDIFMDDVRCRGDEVSLWDCSGRPWGNHNCEHHEDAGVRCGKFLK